MVMQKYPTHKSELGFTLIELLIVIAVIPPKTTKIFVGDNKEKW